MLAMMILPFALAIPAAEPPSADLRIHEYLTAETSRLSDRYLGGAQTRAAWDAKRPQLRRELHEMLGLWPLPAKSPLNATITGTHAAGAVTIEKLHFQSILGLYVTGNLYKPTANAKKLPTILYVCGHSNQGRDGNKVAYQNHGLWFANNGYICLMIDTLQLGEVAGKHHGTYNLNRFWWQNRGYTPAGVECWNGIRAIDYLCSRDDVDAEKIGVTGISGGGATTCWIAATDDRVKVAVPVSGMSDLESYVSHRVINGHCDCMFPINTYRWDWPTILAMFAPKPLLFANSDADPIFPMDGNRRVIAKLRTAYAMLGAKDAVDEYVSNGGHAYRPDLRLAIFRFFDKHLKGNAGPVADFEYPTIAGGSLRVFPKDEDLPKDAINAVADEKFVPVANVALPEKPEQFAAWKSALLKELREKSFRALPESKSELQVGMNDKPNVLQSRKSADRPTNVVVHNPYGTGDDADKFWRDRYPNDDIFAYHLRGSGPNRWTTKNPPNTVERSFALLGQTADSGRVHDAIAVALRTKQPKILLRVIGKQQAGVIVAYAALLSPGTIDEVVIVAPPISHRDGPYFLNVDRVLDLPTALGLLAPDVTLTLVGGKDKAFDKTAAIYKLAGVAEKFRRE